MTAIATEGNQFPQVSVRSAHNVIFERPVAVQLLPKQVRKLDATGLLNSSLEECIAMDVEEDTISLGDKEEP